MDKELGNAIVGVIALIICVAPFVLMRISRRRKEKEHLNLLQKNADSQNCKVDRHASFGNCAIGLDSNRKVVFFHRRMHSDIHQTQIRLSDMVDCHFNTVTRPVDSGNGKVTVIDRIVLVLTPKDTKQKPIKLDFYDSDHDLQLSDQMTQIKVWYRLIQESLPEYE